MKNYLYLLQCKLNPAYCKIGVSNDVEDRIKNIYGEWSLHTKIELNNAQYFETKIKHKLSDLRVSGYELFNCPITYLEKISLETIEEMKEVNLPKTPITIKLCMSDISKLVKKLRISQNITQNELAGASGVGTRLIVDIEKGKETCEIGKVLHILKMLGCTLYVSGEYL